MRHRVNLGVQGWYSPSIWGNSSIAIPCIEVVYTFPHESILQPLEAFRIRQPNSHQMFESAHIIVTIVLLEDNYLINTFVVATAKIL